MQKFERIQRGRSTFINETAMYEKATEGRNKTPRRTINWRLSDSKSERGKQNKRKSLANV